jgi:hypothetical protein
LASIDGDEEKRLFYRGYELEQKPLMVGWQITITKDGSFVRNAGVSQILDTAIDDAHKIIDGLIATAPPAMS